MFVPSIEPKDHHTKRKIAYSAAKVLATVWFAPAMVVVKILI